MIFCIGYPLTLPVILANCKYSIILTCHSVFVGGLFTFPVLHHQDPGCCCCVVCYFKKNLNCLKSGLLFFKISVDIIPKKKAFGLFVNGNFNIFFNSLLYIYYALTFPPHMHIRTFTLFASPAHFWSIFIQFGRGKVSSVHHFHDVLSKIIARCKLHVHLP